MTVACSNLRNVEGANMELMSLIDAIAESILPSKTYNLGLDDADSMKIIVENTELPHSTFVNAEKQL